ncbi:MAG: 16S rRNA (guanine(527)-N(7))-methyltransferase RsmG [Candidatus Eisenbacteria bacterium]
MADDLARLEEISSLLGTRVPAGFVPKCEGFLEELLKWNRRMNLMSQADESRLVARHVLDSLCVLSVVPGLSGKRIVDVGTGAGFPGVVLALWAPDAEIILVESRAKKVAFLNAIRRSLSLANVGVLGSRAEELASSGSLRGTADLVVVRGVGKTARLTASLLELIKPDGAVLFYCSARSCRTAGRSRELPATRTGAEGPGPVMEYRTPAWQTLTSLAVLRKRRTS